MATLSSLVERVRVELGDIGKSFVTQFVADGTTNRFKLNYSPLDASAITVFVDGVDKTNNASIEESSGVLVMDYLPDDGEEFVVSGTFYRYFTAAELNSLVTDALAHHTANHKDSAGRSIDVSLLPTIEEYPVAIYATVLALYTLATDASFDIDIQAPDGVSIPRAERYRQLMDMVQTRKAQYAELCTHLGIGFYKIDVFSLKRISKTTNRYVPVYQPQEVDDRSWPQRVRIPESTYGDKSVEWPTEDVELTAYQGRSFSTALDYTDNWAGKSFIARVLHQRGSIQAHRFFTLSVDTTGLKTVTAATRTSGSNNIVLTSAAHGFTVGTTVVLTDVDESINGTYNVTAVSTDAFTVVGTETTALSLTGLEGSAETTADKEYTFTLSLPKTDTLILAPRTWWSLVTVDYFTGEELEIKGGYLFTVRRSEAAL